MGEHGLCWAHDPENAKQRSKQASRAARSKGNREVTTLKGEIRDVIEDVRSKQLDRNDAVAMIQAYRVLKDFISLERQIREQDEIIQRLDKLEERIELDNNGVKRGGARRW